MYLHVVKFSPLPWSELEEWSWRWETSQPANHSSGVGLEIQDGHRAQCPWLLWQTKIRGPSIDQKIIADKLLMAQNNQGTENDRQMMNSNGHVQHKHGKQSVEMDHFSRSVAVKLLIFFDQLLLSIKMVWNVKCKVAMCCQRGSNSDGLKYCKNQTWVILTLEGTRNALGGNRWKDNNHRYETHVDWEQWLRGQGLITTSSNVIQELKKTRPRMGNPS